MESLVGEGAREELIGFKTIHKCLKFPKGVEIVQVGSVFQSGGTLDDRCTPSSSYSGCPRGAFPREGVGGLETVYGTHRPRCRGVCNPATALGSDSF